MFIIKKNGYISTLSYLFVDTQTKTKHMNRGFKQVTKGRGKYVKKTRDYAPQRGVTKSQVYQMISRNAGEKKYFDLGFNHLFAGTPNDWTTCELPADNYVNSSGTAAAYTDSAMIPSANGSGYGQVVGNRYKIIKLRFRGALYVSPESDQADLKNGCQVRMMLVLDTQPNGAQAQAEDIMQDIGANECLYSYKRIASTSSRFRILKDEFLVLQQIGAGTDGASTNSINYETKQFSFQYTPRKPIEVNIKSGNATPTVAGLINCNIFCIWSAVGGTPNLLGASRCYYMDA